MRAPPPAPATPSINTTPARASFSALRFHDLAVAPILFTLAVGLILLYALLLIGLNLVVDVIHAFLDPRVKYE